MYQPNLGVLTPGDPPNRPPKNQIFDRPNLRWQCFLISVNIKEANILTEFGGTTSQGTPPNDPKKQNILMPQARVPVFLAVSKIKKKIF